MQEPLPSQSSIPNIDSPKEFSTASFNLEFVKQQMPGWLRNAPPERLRLLATSMRLSEESRAARARLLAPLQSIQAFAAPRFSEALNRRFGPHLNETSDRFIRGSQTLQGYAYPNFRPLWERNYAEQGLLQAALHNFSSTQASSDSTLSKLSFIRRGNERLSGIRTIDFIAFCRELDLGGQYQDHINSVFNPDGVVGIPLATRALFKDCDRFALQVDAHLALIQGTICATTYKHLLDISEQQPDIAEQDVKLRYKRLKMAGFATNGISLFEFSFQPLGHLAGIEQPWTKLLVHIPEDPHAPIKEYSGWDAFEADLASKLADENYRRFFLRFVLRKQWPSFYQTLDGLLYEQNAGQRVPRQSPTLSLDGLLRRAPLFEELFSDRLAQLKDDGRFLAVPTAELDASERQATLDKALEVGLDVLGLAAFIVPGVGEALFGVFVGQLMTEVFTGLEDWAEGDRHAALDCLTHAIGEVAGLAVGTAIIGGATALVRHTALLGRLALVRLEDGTQRLCNPELRPYAARLDPSTLGEPSEQGVYQVANQHFIRIDNNFFRVELDAEGETWRIRHPTRQDAWAPELEHNGRGAWRSRFDSPQRWQDSRYLFRRLGHSVEDFSDEEIVSILALSDTDVPQLRRLHLDRQPPTGRLLEAMTRVRLLRRLTRFSEQLQANSRMLDETLALRAVQRSPGWPSGRRIEIVEQLLEVPSFNMQLLRTAVDNDGVLQSVVNALDTQERIRLMPSAASGPEDGATLASELNHGLQSSWLGFFEHCLEVESSPSISPLSRSFPGLSPAIIDDIEASANDAERLRMERGRRVPLRLAEQARRALRESRLSHALEGFFWPLMATNDSDTLLLHFLQQDVRWPRSLKLQIEGLGTDSGSRQLLRRGGLYVDSRHPEKSPQDLLELAWEVAGLGPIENPQAFRHQLGLEASKQRDAARRALGEAQQHWWTPLQRLEDGRRGYALSGRGQLPTTTTRSIEEEILELYPDFSAQDIENYLAPYRTQPAAARALLQRRRDELQRLQVALQRWRDQPGSSRQAASRQHFSDRLIRAWRRQASSIQTPIGQQLGYSLLVNDLHIGELPTLQAIDLNHIVELGLSGMRLSDVPRGFLEHFGRLRFVDLSHNDLTRLPDGLEQRFTLRQIRLRDNRIVLDEDGSQRLAAMWNIESIDLTGNPLGRAPDVTQMTHLRVLQLRNTDIEELPTGLWDRPALEVADLRENRIDQLPIGFLDEPRDFLRRVHLDDNPLPDSLRRQLDSRQGVVRMPTQTPPLHSGPGLWATPRGPHRQLFEYWQTLQQEPDSQAFLSMLERLADTPEARELTEEMRERVRLVLQAAVESGMAPILFEFAESPRWVGTNPLWTFTSLEIQIQAYRALHGALLDLTPTRLIEFARSLRNLDRLERYLHTHLESHPSWWSRQEEVHLAYRQALHQRLQLPGNTQSVRLDDLIIEESDLAAAEAHVVKNEQVSFTTFLINQDFWIQYLRVRRADAWHELDGQFAQREHLQRFREGQLPEAERVRRESARQLQQAADEDALLLQLTREALGLPFDPLTAPRRNA